MSLEFSRFRVLTFDCYGTMIDWESGILHAVRAAFPGKTLKNEEILAAYAEFEPAIQAESFLPYREVLRRVMHRMGERFGRRFTDEEAGALAESIRGWQPFPDTVEALRRLQTRFKLGVISNIDNDLFAHSARWLEVPFDLVVTAQQAGSYKPSLRNFEMARERLGADPSAWLHVAESLFHDVAPARSLGLATVWVNRRAGRPGATRMADATPDLEVPDLKSLADLAV